MKNNVANIGDAAKVVVNKKKKKKIFYVRKIRQLPLVIYIILIRFKRRRRKM